MKKIIPIVLLALFVLCGCGPSAGLGGNEEREYEIQVTAEHADVTAPAKAKAGTSVALDIRPDDGYYLDGITVNGTPLDSATFRMPACDCAVEVLCGSADALYPIRVREEVGGTLIPQADEARAGEIVRVIAVEADGYRLSKLYAYGVPVPFTAEGDAYAANVVMQSAPLELVGEFRPRAGITSDYRYLLASTEGRAISHWKFEYTDDGLIVRVAVEDDTLVKTASAVYAADNVEFQMAVASEEELPERAHAMRCLMNAGGRFELYSMLTDTTYSNMLDDCRYGIDFKEDIHECTSEKDGYDGYFVEVFLSYEMFGLTAENGRGALTFSPAIRDTIPQAVGTLSYWNSAGYDLNTRTYSRLLADPWRCFWSNPASYLGIAEDGTVFSRYLQSYAETDYLFAGDSYFNPGFWKRFKEDTADISSCNLGISSSQTTHWNEPSMLAFLRSLAPKHIVTHIGLNDVNINPSLTVDGAVLRIKNALDAFHAQVPSAQIVWLELEPNIAYKDVFTTRYEPINAAIAAYAETQSWLETVSSRDALLSGSPTPLPSRYLDGLHFGSFGYAVYVNVIREALGLDPVSSSEHFGNAPKGYMTSGWTEKDGILGQYGELPGHSDRFIYFKDFAGGAFTAEASFNVGEVFNKDAAPKFGFIVSEGENHLYFAADTDLELMRRAMIMGTVTSAEKTLQTAWSNGRAINYYFTGEDYVTFKLVKSGNRYSMYVNGVLCFTVTPSVCTGEVSVGVFGFNVQLNVKNASIKGEADA